MMGFQTAPAQLFYDFCLDDHVPADHLLRRIDRFLDLESVRTALKPFYSSIGRLSVDPELMMRMLIVGYCMGLRSERRLCEEVGCVANLEKGRKEGRRSVLHSGSKQIELLCE
jgi:transposase